MMTNTFLNKEDLKAEMGRRLVKAREDAGFRKRIDAVRHFRWNPNTYKSHEYGERAFNRDDAERYAKAYGTSPFHLLVMDSSPAALLDNWNSGGTSLVQAWQTKPSRSYGFAEPDSFEVEQLVPSIPVYGVSAGGMWLEGEENPFEDDEAMVPAAVGYPPSIQYARLVKGNSVSNRIKDGEYAIFVKLDRFNRRLQPGMLVDVERIRAGLREHTVKVYDSSRLVTDSAELDQQTSIPIEPDESDYEVRIVGVAIGKYQPLNV